MQAPADQVPNDDDDDDAVYGAFARLRRLRMPGPAQVHADDSDGMSDVDMAFDRLRARRARSGDAAVEQPDAADAVEAPDDAVEQPDHALEPPDDAVERVASVAEEADNSKFACLSSVRALFSKAHIFTIGSHGYRGVK